MPHQPKSPWFAVRKEISPRKRLAALVLAIMAPLGFWCAVSYIPNLYMPEVVVTSPGDIGYFSEGGRVNKELFRSENVAMLEQGKIPAQGYRANPIYLPAPHAVGKAFYTAFKTPPRRRGEPWLHESLLHSIRVIFRGFLYSCILGIPIGILCGTFSIVARVLEPPVDFIRYMPAPVFGALMVAFLGINDAPKIAIIFIGTFFQMVLVISNTTRQLNPALLEAAQTLGASNRKLVTRVVIPGILPNLYNDLRILLGWAWTYLIVAELIGSMSGISAFIYQQQRYKNYENVYAAIIMIGCIGLFTDQFLAFLGRGLFPWTGKTSRWRTWFNLGLTNMRKAAMETRYGTPPNERP